MSHNIGEIVAQRLARQASENVVDEVEKNALVSTQDVSKIKTEVEGKQLLDGNKEYRKVKGAGVKMKAGLAIGLAAFTAATAMDIHNELRAEKRTDRMINQQEKNLHRKQSKEREMNSSLGYGHVDLGQIAIDMFNQRTGHFKMGNSKFQ